LTAIYLAIAVFFIGFNSGDNYEKVPIYYLTLFILYLTSSGIGDALSIIVQD